MRDDGTGVPDEFGDHCFTWPGWQTGAAGGVGSNALPAEPIGFRRVSVEQRREERLSRRGVLVVRQISNRKR